MNRSLTTWSLLLAAGFILQTAAAQAGAGDVGRFFFSGNGVIRLVSEKNGETFSGRYRTGLGIYDPKSLKAICRVFDAPFTTRGMGLSLRLVEFLDLLEDRLGATEGIAITSGYRNPTYNTKLRNRGGLVAKASLHQYGMAADLKMNGVPARRIWEYVKSLGYGGAGYYQGDSVHIDVGPARSWDEKTSGVDTGISDDNRLIGLVANYDVYLPGEEVTLRFIRMTAFPIGISTEFALERQGDDGSSVTLAVFTPFFAAPAEGRCPVFEDIETMASIRWRLPPELPAGRYRIRAAFCNNPWDRMPAQVATPEFEIAGR
jgi:uncharacterized protein YcbK (DUF882 family)